MHAALLKPAKVCDGSIRLGAPSSRSAFPPLSRRLHQGQPLFHEGDRANRVYEVAKGVMRLARVQPDGRRQVIDFAFPGDVVGLPADERHTTECEAITDCDLLVHRCPSPTEHDGNPVLHRALLDAALQEIRRLQNHFVLLGRRRALEKTAAFVALLLDRISEPIGRYRMIRLAMNRADIADYLGLTPETVSRCFTELRGRHVLALDDANTVIVLDAARLRTLADGDTGL